MPLWSIVTLSCIAGVAATSVLFFIFRNRKSKKQSGFIEKHGTMNLILLIIGIFALLFTSVIIALFVIYGQIPDTLVTCVFSFIGGECGFMAVIRSFKEKYIDRKIELEDREYLSKQNESSEKEE